MITILESINNLFKAEENKDRYFTFNEMFEVVEKDLHDKWASENHGSLSQYNITEIKMGEVYKLLTLDGRFIRHEDGTWTYKKINEAI